MGRNWINVKTRLPSEKDSSGRPKRVLVYRADTNEGQRDMAYGVMDGSMLRFSNEHTWWMDLPEAPIPIIPINSNIPKEQWGVHASHCCFEHGCKYGDNDCPVVTGEIKQKYECEECKIEKLK
jgi:hypothetical protein